MTPVDKGKSAARQCVTDSEGIGESSGRKRKSTHTEFDEIGKSIAASRASLGGILSEQRKQMLDVTNKLYEVEVSKEHRVQESEQRK